MYSYIKVISLSANLTLEVDYHPTFARRVTEVLCSFRFDLMYGVTESEKFHILPPVALLHGMPDSQKDEVLRDHAKVRVD